VTADRIGGGGGRAGDDGGMRDRAYQPGTASSMKHGISFQHGDHVMAILGGDLVVVVSWGQECELLG
jgi:hypothetical protein